MANQFLLPAEYVTDVGRVVVNFQHLEFLIVRLIWIMAAADENIGQRITAGVSFSKLLDLLASVFHYRVQERAMLDEFDHLIKRVRKVNEDRNRVVHSWWFIDFDSGANSGTPSRLKFTARGARTDSENIDMYALSVSAVQLSDDFSKFIDKLYESKLISNKLGFSV